MFTPTSTRGKSKTIVIPLNGFFDDGIWKCNCKPRLPAARFQVRKQGPNTGKWFLTCQEPREQGCGFFLWDEKAKDREKRAVLSNSRTEPEPELDQVDAIPAPDFGRRLGSSKKDAGGFEEYMQDSSKRNAVQGRKITGDDADDDDEFDWPLSPGEERSVEDAVSRASVEVVTPVSGKSRKMGIFDTPGSKRKRDADVYPTPDSRTNRDSTVGGREREFLQSEIVGTPTPTRYFNALNDQPSSSQASSVFDSQNSTATISNDLDFTDEVFNLLQEGNVKMDGGTERKLKGVLDRYVLKLRGAVKGREITREALRGKERRIGELEERVRGLEVERELGRGALRGIKREESGG